MMDPTAVNRLLQLAELPSTGVLQEELQRQEGAERAGMMPARAIELNLERARKRLALGIERDEIRASRPADCWCLGIGGKEIFFHPDDDIYECRGGYCSCDDGRRVEADARKVLDRLAAEKRAQHIERLIKEVNFPRRLVTATFDTYPVHRETKASAHLIRRWASDSEKKYRNSLFVWGPTGTGKTGLAVASMKAIMRDTEEAGFFWTVPGLLTDIKCRFDGGGADDLVLDVAAAPLLILDDLGAEKPSDWTRDILFQVINTRHSDDSLTIITSNLSLLELTERKHIDDRLAWRIIEMSEIVELVGPNLRDRSRPTPEVEQAIEEADAILRKSGRR